MKLSEFIGVLSLGYTTGDEDFVPQAWVCLYDSKTGGDLTDKMFLDRTGVPSPRTEWWAQVKDKKVDSISVGTDMDGKAEVSIYIDR